MHNLFVFIDGEKDQWIIDLLKELDENSYEIIDIVKNEYNSKVFNEISNKHPSFKKLPLMIVGNDLRVVTDIGMQKEAIKKVRSWQDSQKNIIKM